MCAEALSVVALPDMRKLAPCEGGPLVQLQLPQLTFQDIQGRILGM
jgi:hypothetical protein